MPAILKVNGLCKRFVLHAQHGVEIEVFDKLDLRLEEDEALAIVGHSGTGKSSLIKLIYGTYRPNRGQILIRHGGEWTDIACCGPRRIIELRRHAMSCVSQFLRVIPRVSALDIVAEPLLERGADDGKAHRKAGELLERLHIPEKLWGLSPLTFSGGEQQRVNIARGFATPSPVMLLDEPTASLDDANRQTVIELINETRAGGTVFLGIFHSKADRDAACTRAFDLGQFAGAAR